MDIFKTLNAIDVNEHKDEKNGLHYLSWAWAWAEVKKAYPEANYKIYENADGWNYFTDGKTGWVKTGVTIEGLEHIEYLPIMDYKNRSIPSDQITSFDVNKAIQRSITKACGRHGLGLYIYAGEDLPEDAKQEAPKKAPAKKAEPKKAPAKKDTQKARIEEADIRAKVLGYFTRHEFSQEKLDTICKVYKVGKVTELSAQQCQHYITSLEKNGGSINE